MPFATNRSRRRTDLGPSGETSTATTSASPATNLSSRSSHELDTPQNVPLSTPQTPSSALLDSHALDPLSLFHRDHMSVVAGEPQSIISPVDYTAYAPSALGWDGDNRLYPDFAHFYEPQGELLHELHEQQQAGNDFVLPQPIAGHQGETAILIAEQYRTDAVVQSSARTPRAVPGARPPDLPPPPSRMSTMASVQTSLKRKSDSDASPVLQQGGDSQMPPAKRAAKGRSSSTTTPTSTKPDRAPIATRSQPTVNTSIVPLAVADTPAESSVPPEGEPSTARPAGNEAEANSATTERAPSTLKTRKLDVSSKFSSILPAGKVFPIQIGSELFRLSGASISSDAPSYFSHFFSEQLLNNTGKSGSIRTLYIDRDPQTFRDISLHLQGYHVKPRDGEHYVRLFADAQFYSLPRLTQQLFKTDIYIQIGDRNFQIPRDIFSSPGNSPNFFSLGFAHFFSTPSEVFPGLDRTSLLRPPSIQPPCVPNRSADVFRDLLRLLQGYPVRIRDENHRQDLLRDARYFHLKGLEQKLIPCEVSFNLARQQSEIVIRLEDIRQSGVSFTADPESNSADITSAAGGGAQSVHGSKPATPIAVTPAPGGAGASSFAHKAPSGYIYYARPFTDESSHALIVETSASEATSIDLAAMRAAFTGQTKARIASLFQVIANKMNLPATQPLGLMLVERGGGLAAMPVSPSNSGVSGDRVRVEIGSDAWCEVDGGVVEWAAVDGAREGLGAEDDDEEVRPALPPVRHWRPQGASKIEDRRLDPMGEWVVSKAHWRLRVQPAEDDARIVEVVMQAVRLEANTGERVRNGRRGFLV